MTPAGDPCERRTRLVLLAGLLCDETIWRDVADRMNGVAEVVILSFAGFDSIEAMAAEAVSRIAKPGVALAGHSMGGRVALEVMRQAPGLVERLALLNTGIHPTADHEAETRGRLTGLARHEGMAAVAAEWLPPMLGAGSGNPALVKRLTAMVERQDPDSFAGQIRALLNRPEAESVLASVHVPTLLLSGTRDRWSPVSQHEAMRAIIPHASLTVVDDAGHMAPAEAPAAVAAAMQRWVAA